MNGYVADIEELTKDNEAFRRVIFTARHLQLVLMTLQPGEAIGSETHATHDQFFRIEKGKGDIVIDGETHHVKGGTGIAVPAGMTHNLTNTGEKPLRLYTLYGPPNHADRLVQETKSEPARPPVQVDGDINF